MRLFRIFSIISLLGLTLQATAHAVEAADPPPPPAIAFLDVPEEGITISQKDLPYQVQVVNQSSEAVTFSIYLIGELENFLSASSVGRDTDGTVGPELGPGKVLETTLDRLPEAAKEELDKGASGLLVITTSGGDVIYRRVTLLPAAGTPQIDEKDKVTLLDFEDGKSFDWDSLLARRLDLLIVNENDADSHLVVMIRLIKPDGTIGQSHYCFLATDYNKTVDKYFCELTEIDDLVENPSWVGTRTGIITIQDEAATWIKTVTFKLNIPFAEGTLLRLPGSPDQLAFDFHRLQDQGIILTLENPSSIPVQITGVVMLLGGFEPQAVPTITATPAQTPASTSTAPLEGGKPNGETAPRFTLAGALPTVEPYSLASLTLKLDEASAKSLTPGTHDGRLLIYTTEGTPPTLTVPFSMVVADIDPSLPTISYRLGVKVQQAVQGAPAWLGLEETRFGEIEWALAWGLLILAGYILLFASIKLRAWWRVSRGKLGPVVVVGPSGKEDLGAYIRQYLAECGNFKVSGTPNVALGLETLKTVIEESKVPEAKFIAALLAILKSIPLPQAGYTITNAYSLEGTRHCLTLQIKDSRTGRSERTFRLEAETAEKVCQKAGWAAYWYISGRRNALQHIPEWSRFSNEASHCLYKQGQESKRAEDYEKAVEKFQAAALKDPFNIMVHLETGTSYELNKKPVSALHVFLRCATTWPHFYSAWYRAAAILSAPEKWFKDLKAEEKEDLAGRLQDALQTLKENRQWAEALKDLDDSPEQGLRDKRAAPEADKLVKKSEFLSRFLTNEPVPEARQSATMLQMSEKDLKILAWLLFTFLKRSHGWGSQIYNWLSHALRNLWNGIVHPTRHVPRLALYYWKHLSPFPWSAREQFRRMLELAQYCTEVDFYPEDHHDQDELKRKASSVAGMFWNSANVYYNAACFYALVSAKESGTDALDDQENALKWLTLACKDPKTAPDVEWIRIDPDFSALAKNKEFTTLFDIPDKDAKEKADRAECKALYAGLDMILEVARQQQIDWDPSKTQSISAEELVVIAAHQARVWKSLRSLCANQKEADPKEDFWQVGMLNSVIFKPLPEAPSHAIPAEKLGDTLLKIRGCWKDLARMASAREGVWLERQNEVKVYLEHGKAKVLPVWVLWGKEEGRHWKYVESMIPPMPAKPKELARKKTSKPG